jgi:hypothetical protein
MSVLAFLHGGTTGIYLFARLAIGLAVSSIMRNDLGSHVTICKKLKRKHRKAPETIIGQNVIWVKYMFNCVYLPRPERKKASHEAQTSASTSPQATLPRAPISPKGIKRSAQKVLHSKNPKGGCIGVKNQDATSNM